MQASMVGLLSSHVSPLVRCCVRPSIRVCYASAVVWRQPRWHQPSRAATARGAFRLRIEVVTHHN
jgi:hypothetical protein